MRKTNINTVNKCKWNTPKAMR